MIPDLLRRSARHCAVLTTMILCSSCATHPVKTSEKIDPQLEQQIAQKLMLDIRYFCPTERQDKPCTEPVTKLPPALANMITDSGIGGIILFANNLHDTRQMIALNHDLQHAALAGNHPPLFISIDQEGGRVVRIPHDLGTSFSGNMAIGATYNAHGTEFAEKTGKVLADELLSIGFNVNLAPDVDVNINPANPVINVRSFGEDPQIVGKLGQAQLHAMQQEGIIATLKHFPGHGDTSVDSHTGLPRVDHDLNKVNKVDLAPFKYVIDHDKPAMIMTAHIQYPELDNTEFTATDGKPTILPATMSRKILTGVLRDQLGYQGVIITDALNMAGIAKFFTPTDAVIQTFKAGSDIALMPIAIRYPSDIPKVKALIHAVAKAVQDGRLNREEIAASAQRIANLKQQYQLSQKVQLNINKATAEANQVLGNPEHRQVEQQLADAAITVVKNQQAFPLADNDQPIALLMPDTTKCMAMIGALKSRLPQRPITCTSMLDVDPVKLQQQITAASVVIGADISPGQSLVEMGGMDDLTAWHMAEKEGQTPQLGDLLKQAHQQGKTTLLISLRTPYNVPEFEPYTDGILATFAYNLSKTQFIDDYGRLIVQYHGPIFHALADVLSGNKKATGSLPVSIN